MFRRQCMAMEKKRTNMLVIFSNEAMRQYQRSHCNFGNTRTTLLSSVGNENLLVKILIAFIIATLMAGDHTYCHQYWHFIGVCGNMCERSIMLRSHILPIAYCLIALLFPVIGNTLSMCSHMGKLLP